MCKQPMTMRRGLPRLAGRGVVAILMMGLLGACGPIVRSDYDSKTPITNYRSYAWEQEKEPQNPRNKAFYNPINEKRLREAVAAQLSAKGLQPVAEGAMADALVSVAIGSRHTFEPEPAVRWGFGFGWGRRGYGSSVGLSTDTGYLYREGSISVDIYDAKTREPIWHAAVDTDVTTLTGDNAEKRIDAAVQAMFAKFPKSL